MGGKTQKIYDALVDGAERGLTGELLFRHVPSHVPKATSKKIVKASLFALSDQDLLNKEILSAIYDLAIAHRIDPRSYDGSGEPEPALGLKKADSPRRKAARSDGAAHEAGDVIGE